MSTIGFTGEWRVASDEIKSGSNTEDAEGAEGSEKKWRVARESRQIEEGFVASLGMTDRETRTPAGSQRYEIAKDQDADRMPLRGKPAVRNDSRCARLRVWMEPTRRTGVSLDAWRGRIAGSARRSLIRR